MTPLVWLIVIVGVAYLLWQQHQAANEEARAWLARRGYRVYCGRLWRVQHEDDEGWWTADDLGSVSSAWAARRRLEGDA